MKIYYLYFVVVLFISVQIQAQSNKIELANNKWHLQLNENGTVASLKVKRGNSWDNIAFQQDTCMGISWYKMANKQHQLIKLNRVDGFSFTGNDSGIIYSLEYQFINDELAVVAKVKNTTTNDLLPEKLGLVFGLSNYMVNYPQWNNIYFPTLLRCEKTHFWGYLMNPNGSIMGIASPDPVASWSLNYNYGYGAGDGYFFWGHRVYTFNLDLFNTLPLPARHPQNQDRLKSGEQKSWTIYLKDINGLQSVQKTLSPLCNAPLVELPHTSLEDGNSIDILTNNPENIELTITSPANKVYKKSLAKGIKTFSYKPVDGDGVYTIKATSVSGKQTEAMFSVLKPWSWYLKQGRVASLKYTQKASWNCENWYGFYSAYLAQQYFPDKELLKQTNDRFDLVISLMYDTVKGIPLKNPNRIQNTAITIGIYVDKYKALGNINDLETAAKLTDWLISHGQSVDGAYRNGKTHYTSVIYIAKSLMELYQEEKKLGKTYPEWQERYEKHYASVKKAIDQLMLGQSAIDTEGELTFEDGMISCSALQIAAFALQQEDEKERKRYADTAIHFLQNHNCLTQQVIPDSRQRGGTLRFWEAQYDVMLANNMLASPHGWTSWRTYGTYYMYLLTGDEQWLIQTMNALGSCMQVIDRTTGDLRWAFVVDPYVNTLQSSENFPNTDPDKYNANQFKAENGKCKPLIIGEQYVNMVADWFHANTSDNDVHEHFKCMEEVVLTSAYVVERSDGTLMGYNCSVKKKQQTIVIVPNESVINKVHVNLKKSYPITIEWTGKKTKVVADGMKWIAK